MTVLLDTSVVVEMLRKGEYREGSISIITVIEVLRGVRGERRRRVKELLEEAFEVHGLSNDVILKYCELYDALRARGELIPDADLLIAATALSVGETLVTKDKHFERLRREGLNVTILET